METVMLGANGHDIETAADILRNGGLCAIPTETVYGLAANALDEQAVRNIFIAKGRAQDNPLIVHISDISELPPLVKEIPDIVYRLAERFWPGPLTMIMYKSELIPDAVTCGGDTVAIRMPQNEIARKIIKATGRPLAAPSANLSGGVSPVTAQHCMRDLSGRVDAILDGGECTVGLESTVISCVTNPIRLLRPGFVTVDDLKSVCGEVLVDEAVLHPLKDGVKPASPGMKYTHYSPKAKVIILNGDSAAYCNYVNQNGGENVFSLCFDEDISALKVPYISYGGENDGAKQAERLFYSLRELDDMGARMIYARMPKSDGVGLAVLNRLLRSAGFHVIDL